MLGVLLRFSYLPPATLWLHAHRPNNNNICSRNFLPRQNLLFISKSKLNVSLAMSFVRALRRFHCIWLTVMNGIVCFRPFGMSFVFEAAWSTVQQHFWFY